MADQLKYTRKLTVCVLPSATRKNDANFKRVLDESFTLDHTEAAPFGPVKIDPSGSFSVPFQGLVSGRGLFLESDGAVDLGFSGGVERVSITPPKVPSGEAARKAIVSLDCTFSALVLENPSASAAIYVTGYIVGD